MRAGLRRAFVAAVTMCAAVAALALPARAQTQFLFIDTFSPYCGAVGAATRVGIAGGTSSASVTITTFDPSGGVVGSQSVAASSSRYSASVPFTPKVSGDYEIRVTGGSLTASAFYSVPCQPQTLSYNPPCFVVGTTATVTMTGQHFNPYRAGYITYDVNGPETQQQIRIPIDAHGTFSASFKVNPSNRNYPGSATDQVSTATATWSPCPPPTTSTSTTSTTAPPSSTSTPTTATTVKTTGTTSTSTTIPTITTIPPPTPGATLTVTPPLGKPGFVAMAHGTGFPPGPVNVGWSPGIGLYIATAGADGTFDLPMLVMNHDILGPRTLVATSGATSASAAFLVVPSTVKPSGKDVAQINRIRRFLNR